MAKANIRLQRPSSHTRLLSRVAIWDVVWGGISPLAAYLLRDGTIIHPGTVAVYCGISILTSLLVFQWFQTSSPIARFYSIRDALELLKACVLITALSAVLAFLLTRLDEAPRSIPLLQFLLLASGLLGGRVLLRLRETRRETRRPNAANRMEYVLIIGATRLAWFFSKMVEELAPAVYQIVAILDERQNLKHRSLNGYPIVGSPADLEKVIADYAMHGVRIEKVVLAAQPEDIAPVAWNEVSSVCSRLHIELEILPERLMSERAANDDQPEIDLPLIDSPEVVGSRFAPPPKRLFWKIKRGVDFTVALGLALLLSPIILIVCIFVLIDVGIPIVFWQQRLGRQGAPLHLYKFRTLETLFDRQTKEKREAQEASSIGAFLQRTRLDELPQLWNVLRGDMSLIGPRPLLPIDQPRETSLRLSVRPGITGWAQICGGKLITVEEKNALDEWYIRHASPWLEMVILAGTMRVFLIGDWRNEKAITAALIERRSRGATDSSGEGKTEVKNMTIDLTGFHPARPAEKDASNGIVERAGAVRS